MTKKKITGKIKLSEIIQINPDAGMILFEYGMHCIGCGMASVETLEQGCMAHGMNKKDIKELIEKLNEKKEEKKEIYSIFYLIKGEAKKYRDKLVKEVGPRFGEKYVLESKLPAHITLKIPFETSNIKELEKILEDFSKKHKSSEIKIIGFGNFRKKVAFLKFKSSKSTLKTQSELIKEINKIKEIKIHPHDKKLHLHATISYGNTKKSFNGIWNYLKKLKKPQFDLKFDNIAIMKKSGKYWKVHKEFKLK